MNKNKPLLGLLAIGAGLRLFQVARAPLWYDETFSAWLAGLPLLDMIKATAGDVHPPLYQLILWPIAHLEGGAFWLRLPSVIFSTISLYLIWLICKRINLSDTTALVAVGIAAITPMDIHFAQEARQYALLQMLVLSSTLAALKRRWLWIGINGAALIYTHNYGLFYLAALWLVSMAIEALTTARVVQLDRPEFYRVGGYANVPEIQSDFRSIYLAYGAPLCVFLPWAIVLATQMQTVSGSYWIQFTWGSVLYAISCLFYGFAMPEQLQPVGVLILAALLFLALLAGLKDKRLRLPIWLGFAPLAMAVVISLIWQPVLLFRGLIGSAPFLYVLIASLITRPGRQVQSYILAGAIIPLLLGGLINHYTVNPANKDGGTSDILTILDDQLRPGETLRYTNDAAAVIVGYNRPAMQGAVIGGCSNLGGLSSTTRAAMGITTTDDLLDWSGLFIYAIGPTSSQCEQDKADRLAAASTLLIELKSDQLTTVRIYRHEDQRAITRQNRQ
jgi:hypothetical protein